MFIPTTKEELIKLNWKELDVILVSGDTYIDSSYIGVSVIGRVLLNAGFRVGIIAQPAIDSDVDIKRLGEPKLFWGISSGSMDSMVANYTALLKKRKQDDFTPGTVNNKRPDRALIVYCNLIKKYFKNSVPIILGGVEATLRRFSHYDYWSDKLKRSILLDSKADLLVYGMGEKAILELAQIFRKFRECRESGNNYLNYSDELKRVRGILYTAKEVPTTWEFLELPSHQSVLESKESFALMFDQFYMNNDPKNAKALYQACDKNRFLIQNPPALHLTTSELDSIYELPYQRDVHPYYKKDGEVRALNTIKFSITTHRGCYGECNFCSINLHQGRTILSRSIDSIIREITQIASRDDFKGYISDLGGATANMYGGDCALKLEVGGCKNKRCLFPQKCQKMPHFHHQQLKLLERVSEIKDVNDVKNVKVKKVFISSGIRYDLVVSDEKFGIKYLKKIIKDHTSGQLKLAPEHIDEEVLKLMGKPTDPGQKMLLQFKKSFEDINKELGLKQFLTYYFMVCYPGCNDQNALNLKSFIKKNMKFTPEQVQIFTPLPSTYGSLMYYLSSCLDSDHIYIEKNLKEKEKQKMCLF
ncbi:MAG: YgiQ family radical SAM protein [Oligoflexia bacterium]|nr:YgiQ family radical SAM protein [Oligoflexia bacterium]